MNVNIANDLLDEIEANQPIRAIKKLREYGGFNIIADGQRVPKIGLRESKDVIDRVRGTYASHGRVLALDTIVHELTRLGISSDLSPEDKHSMFFNRASQAMVDLQRAYKTLTESLEAMQKVMPELTTALKREEKRVVKRPTRGE